MDSIRSFDSLSQRSIENLEEIVLYPAAERLGEEGMVSFADYFPLDKTLLILDEPNRMIEKGQEVEEEFRQSQKNRLEKGDRPLADNLLFEMDRLCEKLNQFHGAALCMLEPAKNYWKIRERFELTVKTVSSYNNSFELLVKDLKKWKKDGYRVALLSGSRTRAKRLAQDLMDEGLGKFLQ